MTRKEAKVGLAVVAGFTLLGLWLAAQFFCFSAWLRYGVSLSRCPAGTPRQTLTVHAERLRRGASGSVRVGAQAHYSVGRADEDRVAWVSRVHPALFLVAGDKETPLVPKRGWQDSEPFRVASVDLPEVPDGDYLLRAKVETPLGRQSLDVPLPVYAPARVHVLTDRPLYEPGHTVRFRALALRAKDLTPLDGRPGIWTVTDPSGEVLLEEKSPAGPWGVAGGSFPLDSGAAPGDWTVRWSSGDAGSEARFRVQPFTLPRFRVEAAAARPFYGRGEAPVVRGSVAYSSGAPVAGARVSLAWRVLGSWPAPLDWTEGGLPREAVADAGGRFELALPRVPGDLRGQVTLAAALEATDPAGDRVDGAVSVLLAEESIAVSAVTELGEGLVQGFNNRLFLRVTDAAGMVLPEAELTVKRAWDPTDKGLSAKADEDGVASLQIDPGPAVNVVIPAMPYRPPPRPRAARLQSVSDLVSGDEPSLADRKVIDGWLAAVEPCARFAGEGDETALGVRADASGAILAVGADARPLSRCAAAAIRERRLAPGAERLLIASFEFDDPALPTVTPHVEGVPEVPEGLAEAVHAAAADARGCLPKNLNEELGLARFATWKTTKGSKLVSFAWANDPAAGEGRGLRADACFEPKLASVELAGPAEHAAVGLARFHVTPYLEPGRDRPQATTMLGYELLISARVGGEEAGTARLRLSPGDVPDIRLRATPVLAKPGGELKVEILRGPNFAGSLPKSLTLVNEGRSWEEKTDANQRSATFKIPADAQGWLQVSWGGATALAWLEPKAHLAVSLRPARERYAPGETAKLLLETRAGDRGVAAAVGLFGVDESLAQLAPLPGADELAKLRAQASMSAPAFAALDAQALTLGRIRGANAAAAVVLRVTAPPPAEELDRSVTARAAGAFTPLEDLTDHFYAVLAELHAQARAWEDGAPESERMHPRTMAGLWEKALAACEKRGEAVSDAYGRRLRLSWLPRDLLALTDPRLVVVKGTRLPEDIENWQAWVAKEKP